MFCFLFYFFFFAEKIDDAPGDVCELGSGAVVGRHRGLHYHTIGQRRGVGPVLHPKVVSQSVSPSWNEIC